MCAVETLMIKPKAVKVSLLDDAARVESLAVLSRFRTGFYDCLTARTDALFVLTAAVLCTDGDPACDTACGDVASCVDTQPRRLGHSPFATAAPRDLWQNRLG